MCRKTLKVWLLHVGQLLQYYIRRIKKDVVSWILEQYYMEALRGKDIGQNRHMGHFKQLGTESV